MKIMVIAPGSMSKEEIKMRQDYAQSLCSSEIKVVDIEGPSSLTDECTLGLLVPGVIKRAEEANNNGYDAVVVHCFADIGVEGAKTVADIPVVGAAECSYRVASLLADRFGLITAREEYIPSFYRRARTLGVADRIASSRSINIPVLELRQRRDEVEARFIEQIKKAISEGAQIILVSCLAILPTLGKGSAKRLSEKLGIQIIDGTATALRVAEMLVNLNLRQSRLTFPRAPEIWHR
jgi:allantoin racemase